MPLYHCYDVLRHHCGNTETDEDIEAPSSFAARREFAIHQDIPILEVCAIRIWDI
jgi:hypothetical protein